jgi:hypothetical protein
MFKLNMTIVLVRVTSRVHASLLPFVHYFLALLLCAGFAGVGLCPCLSACLLVRPSV